eukprot:gnl/TRDRNA2_/TRDRNA2_92442_c0_seq1.p1 gnl/TRDRNA2_/TRDRNA2_92442_c0~~gnl/TRDRNA2_/TRDRNA2_92442_c0_seq1.p1  ORF type:complete len:258 (-),score=32.17 gnl/TRDRNA2_/TRDRNA2_92442_c0_seq1:155-928(-)
MRLPLLDVENGEARSGSQERQPIRNAAAVTWAVAGSLSGLLMLGCVMRLNAVPAANLDVDELSQASMFDAADLGDTALGMSLSGRQATSRQILVPFRHPPRYQSPLLQRQHIPGGLAPASLWSVDGPHVNRMFVAAEADQKALIASRTKLIIQMEENPCIIYSSTAECPSSAEVQKVLDEYGAKYGVIELDKRPDGDELQAALTQAVPQLDSLPAVFVDGEYLGGLDGGGLGGVKALHDKGVLKKMLLDVGCLKPDR